MSEEDIGFRFTTHMLGAYFKLHKPELCDNDNDNTAMNEMIC